MTDFRPQKTPYDRNVDHILDTHRRIVDAIRAGISDAGLKSRFTHIDNVDQWRDHARSGCKVCGDKGTERCGSDHDQRRS